MWYKYETIMDKFIAFNFVNRKRIGLPYLWDIYFFENAYVTSKEIDLTKVNSTLIDRKEIQINTFYDPDA